jgi:O-antigen ligase
MISAMILKARERAGKINQWLTALLAFALPLSTSAITVLALLILLLWVFEGRFAEKFVKIKSNPVALSVLGLLAVLVIGLTWSPAVPAGLEVLMGRWKLAMLPVFLTAVDCKHPKRYIYFFVAGTSVAMSMTFLAKFGYLHYADVNTIHLTKKNSHVVYNPMLAIAIYFVLHDAIWGRLKILQKSELYLLSAVMICNMFITEGRAGQLAFFVLMILLLLQLFRKRPIQGVIAVCVVIPILFVAGYNLSPAFKRRVVVACKEVHLFHVNPDNSVGFRLLFWENTSVMIREHPFFGVGTGGYEKVYKAINDKRTPGHKATDNPHNQYIFVTAMVGIPGVFFLLLIFLTMFRMAWKTHGYWQRPRLAFPLFFMVIMLTESYLKVYETAFLFSLLSAVLYNRIESQSFTGLANGQTEDEPLGISFSDVLSQRDITQCK